MVVERDTNLVIFFDLSILQPWEVDHFEPNLWDLHWFTLPKTHLAPENGPGPKRKVVFHSFRPSILRCYVSIRECRIRRSQQRCRYHPEHTRFFMFFFGGEVEGAWSMIKIFGGSIEKHVAGIIHWIRTDSKMCLARVGSLKTAAIVFIFRMKWSYLICLMEFGRSLKFSKHILFLLSTPWVLNCFVCHLLVQHAFLVMNSPYFA